MDTAVAEALKVLVGAVEKLRREHRCPAAFGGCYCFTELCMAIAMLEESLPRDPTPSGLKGSH